MTNEEKLRKMQDTNALDSDSIAVFPPKSGNKEDVPLFLSSGGNIYWRATPGEVGDKPSPGGRPLFEYFAPSPPEGTTTSYLDPLSESSLKGLQFTGLPRDAWGMSPAEQIRSYLTLRQSPLARIVSSSARLEGRDPQTGYNDSSRKLELLQLLNNILGLHI